MLRPLCLILVLGALTACTAPLQGPVVDLPAVATPDPPPLPPLPPPLGPVVGTGEFRAWMPQRPLTGGGGIEGHWETLPLAPPVVETLQPMKPMPRAPKTHVQAGKRSDAPVAPPVPTHDAAPGRSGPGLFSLPKELP
jgi:hypothetical protein